MNSDKNYVIFSTNELTTINFSEVLETSADTVRVSIDGTKTFVKWMGEIPQSVQNLTTQGDILTQAEILEILNSPEWNNLQGEE